MAELGAVQAAIGLIGNVVQLVNYLKEVKAAFETIKDDIQALIDEVLTLDKLYGSLKQECDRQQQQAAWDEPRQRLWTLLQQTLDNARSCFGKLEHEVKEVCGDPKDLKWRAKWQKQDRLRSRQLQLGRFRQQLSIFNQVLLLLQNNIFLSDKYAHRLLLSRGGWLTDRQRSDKRFPARCFRAAERDTCRHPRGPRSIGRIRRSESCARPHSSSFFRPGLSGSSGRNQRLAGRCRSERTF